MPTRRESESVFPNLFPNTLEEKCTNRILLDLVRCGKKIEKLAKQIENVSYNTKFDKFHQITYHDNSPVVNTKNRHYTSQYIPPSQTASQNFSKDSKNSSSTFLFSKSIYFVESVDVVKQFLTSFLASSILDSLTDAARRQGNAAQDGHVFCFSVLCNDRLAKLVVSLHEDAHTKTDRNSGIEDQANATEVDNGNKDEKHQDWSKFMLSGVGSGLFLACLGQLSGLSSLTIQDLATNEMLFMIADTCHRLLILDISYSSEVTELGLVYLCGTMETPFSTIGNYLPLEYDNIGSNLGSLHPHLGCRYLRELHFNPRNRNHSTDNTFSIMPRVIAYIFRHLTHLQVMNMENLYHGIEHYYRGVPGEYHPSPNRISTLKLVQYIGDDDQLISIVGICPKLRAYKIKVTSYDAIIKLANTLATDYTPMSLEHVTLVYDDRHHNLSGFDEFISKCGHRIHSLVIINQISSNHVQEREIGDHMEDPRANVTLENLTAISTHCKLLDTLCLENLKIVSSQHPMTPLPNAPLEFRFLTSIQLRNVSITHYPKETFKYILGNSPDLENIHIQFESTSYFFNDFLLDEILSLNPLSKLEEFILENGALTLISALRLFNSRTKFKSIGNLLSWDVEQSELDTFEQILRKAKGLNLLRHDVKIY